MNEDKNATVLKQYQEMFREFRAGATVEDKTHTVGGLIKELKPLFMLLSFLFLTSSATFAGVLLIADIINAVFTENTLHENMVDSFKDFKKKHMATYYHDTSRCNVTGVCEIFYATENSKCTVS
ncbi:hypothetical protein ACT7DD_28155 [Bacillus paranthracis]